MSRLRITATSKPADVLELVDFDAPAPGPGQTLVEVQAANASDFLEATVGEPDIWQH
jgi:NADPH:quinone reductase-like Zn-dependent oxidoreductase